MHYFRIILWIKSTKFALFLVIINCEKFAKNILFVSTLRCGCKEILGRTMIEDDDDDDGQLTYELKGW